MSFSEVWNWHQAVTWDRNVADLISTHSRQPPTHQCGIAIRRSASRLAAILSRISSSPVSAIVSAWHTADVAARCAVSSSNELKYDFLLTIISSQCTHHSTPGATSNATACAMRATMPFGLGTIGSSSFAHPSRHNWTKESAPSACHQFSVHARTQAGRTGFMLTRRQRQLGPRRTMLETLFLKVLMRVTIGTTVDTSAPPQRAKQRAFCASFHKYALRRLRGHQRGVVTQHEA